MEISTTENKQINIRFGVMCDPLAKQLEGQGFKYSSKAIAQFQEYLHAIHVLSFSDLLNNSMREKIIQKLHKKSQSRQKKR